MPILHPFTILKWVLYTLYARPFKAIINSCVPFILIFVLGFPELLGELQIAFVSFLIGHGEICFDALSYHSGG